MEQRSRAAAAGRAASSSAAAVATRPKRATSSAALLAALVSAAVALALLLAASAWGGSGGAPLGSPAEGRARALRAPSTTARPGAEADEDPGARRRLLLPFFHDPRSVEHKGLDPNESKCCHVVKLTATATGDDRWEFAATMSSPYEAITGWRKYCQAFEIRDADSGEGTVLAWRSLRPHPEEQPFTASTKAYAIPPGVRAVVAIARDSVDGHCGHAVRMEMDAPSPIVSTAGPPSACDNVVLLLTDSFAGHGLGSQLNSYQVAALVATHADRALVLMGEDKFVAGCPEDIIIRDEQTERATSTPGLHFTDERSDFPKGLAGLVDHPAWLSRNCPVPCADTHTRADWRKIIEEDPSPFPSASCLTNGRETNVWVVNGNAVLRDTRGKDRMWTDRSTPEALAGAYNWALRLGGDAAEASIFADLREREEILDYALALSARTGAIRFQPWIRRDVAAHIASIEGGIRSSLDSGGAYVGVHVRRGDKLFRESKMFVNEYWGRHPDEEARKYIPLRQYLAQLEGGENDACGTRHVYIATDDPIEVRKEIEELAKNEEGAYQLAEGTCIKFRFSFGPPILNNCYHNLCHKRGMCTNLYQTVVAAVADLTLLAGSETWVGEYNSNWGRLVRAFRMVANDVDRIREGGEAAALERDTRIAWGNKSAKYAWSWCDRSLDCDMGSNTS